MSDPTTDATPKPGPALRAPAIVLAVLALALIVVLVLITPWEPLDAPAADRVAPNPEQDFAPAQIALAEAYHRRQWPAYFASLAVSLLVTLGLGFTSLGARIVQGAARLIGRRRFGQRRSVRLLAGTVAVTGIGFLATLPFDVYRSKTARDYRIVVQGWDAYATDRLIGLGFAIGGSLLGLGIFFALTRRVRNWWAPGAVLAAGLVFATSFVYPVVVEPAFNDFRPLPAGQVRSDLLDLAARDDITVSDVLVADESKRSTRLNAYVSGIGSSRRIVLYDTTLDKLPPEQTRSIVAHELGHVKTDDVLRGTAAAALGAAAGVVLVFLMLSSRRLRRRAGVDDPTEPSALALLLAIVTLLSTLTSPITLAVSRRVEARADVHALNVTRDPATVIAMQQRLSSTNLSDLSPPRWIVWLVSSHPTGPERIAQARTWAKVNGVTLPPSEPAERGTSEARER
ncbi:MAG: M48 family metallopeptidase [Sporichthyaceae bacterium]